MARIEPGEVAVPFYKLGCRLGVVFRVEDRFWRATLKNLAVAFGVRGLVQQSVTCVDPNVQWFNSFRTKRTGKYNPERMTAFCQIFLACDH